MLLCVSVISATENKIVLLNNKGLNLYDMENVVFISPLEDPESWYIYSAIEENGMINIVLNKQNDLSGTLVKSFVVDGHTYSLLSENSYFKSSSSYISLDSNITQLFGPLTKKIAFSSWNGNVYLLDRENENDFIGDYYLDKKNHTPFIRNYFRGKVLCGYYSPLLSKDEKYIVCVYKRSKHERKQNVGKWELVEIEVQSKEVIFLSIYGDRPSYSANANIILYKDIYNGNYKQAKNKWSLYFKENGTIKSIPSAYEVSWVN